MSHYLNSLLDHSDRCCNLPVSIPVDVALNVFPLALSEFDLTLITMPQWVYVDGETCEVLLRLDVNNHADADADCQMYFKTHCVDNEDTDMDKSHVISLNHRHRVDNVNINVNKDYKWFTPNILNRIHKGLNNLVEMQVKNDRGVFYSQNETEHKFTTTLLTTGKFGATRTVYLTVGLYKHAFSLRPC